MIEVILHVCDAFGLTISEKKTETMCMPAPHTSDQDLPLTEYYLDTLAHRLYEDVEVED